VLPVVAVVWAAANSLVESGFSRGAEAAGAGRVAQLLGHTVRLARVNEAVLRAGVWLYNDEEARRGGVECCWAVMCSLVVLHYLICFDVCCRKLCVFELKSSLGLERCGHVFHCPHSCIIAHQPSLSVYLFVCHHVQEASRASPLGAFFHFRHWDDFAASGTVVHWPSVDPDSDPAVPSSTGTALHACMVSELLLVGNGADEDCIGFGSTTLYFDILCCSVLY
jgi:hypothetical protein